MRRKQIAVTRRDPELRLSLGFFFLYVTRPSSSDGSDTVSPPPALSEVPVQAVSAEVHPAAAPALPQVEEVVVSTASPPVDVSCVQSAPVQSALPMSAPAQLAPAISAPVQSPALVPGWQTDMWDKSAAFMRSLHAVAPVVGLVGGRSGL